VLHEDEMDLGVALIDIGGGTTDIAVYSEGSNVFTSVIVMGGHRITQDVAHGLRTSVAEAEAIKRKHGCALISMVQDDDLIEVPGVGPRPPREFKRRFLAEIIEPRVEEIFLMAQQELLASGCAELAASGLVLTGGAASMEGMIEIAEDIFQMPIRKGVPSAPSALRSTRNITLSDGGFATMITDPKFATGVGLVLYGASHEAMHAEPPRARVAREEGPGTLRRLSEWVRERF
jgi:cell division protein FtsA